VTRLRQRSTIAIAMLCLVAQLFAVAHLVLVRHARCAEHGEVTHAGLVEGAPAGAPGGTPDRVPATATPSEFDLLGANHLPAHASDDDHCEWLSETRDARHAATPTFTTVAVSHAAPVPATVQARAVTRPLYRLAPKLSPPRVLA
jgi:hypothetical protein